MSHDPSSTGTFPDSYVEEPQQVPGPSFQRCVCGNATRPNATLTGKCQWCGGLVRPTDDEYVEWINGGLSMKRERERGST